MSIPGNAPSPGPTAPGQGVDACRVCNLPCVPAAWCPVYVWHPPGHLPCALSLASSQVPGCLHTCKSPLTQPSSGLFLGFPQVLKCRG